jgi:hypothetical protein
MSHCSVTFSRPPKVDGERMLRARNTRISGIFRMIINGLDSLRAQSLVDHDLNGN